MLKSEAAARSNAAFFKDLIVSYKNLKRSNAGLSPFILKTYFSILKKVKLTFSALF